MITVYDTRRSKSVKTVPEGRTAREVATDVAIMFGWNPLSNYTLATAQEPRRVVPYEDPAPEEGEWEVLDVGGLV